MIVTRRSLFREGLVRLLADRPGIRIVGHAEQVGRALEHLARLNIDALLVDCTDPNLDPAEVACRVLKARLGTQVIAVDLESNVFTTYRGRSQVVADVEDLTDMLREDEGGEKGQRTADLAASAQNRSGVYGFLAGLYNQLPDDELVEMLRGSAFEGAVRKIVEQADAAEPLREAGRLILGSVVAFRSQPTDQVRTALAVDRTRLVRGIKPGYGPPPPYESVYLGTGTQPEVEATVAVAQAYREAGVTLSAEVHEQPDFIGIELEFMRHLSRQEAEAWARGDETQARQIARRELAFLKDHLVRWVDDYGRRMEEDAEMDFYRGVALLTRFLVTEDLEYLTGLAAEA